MAELCQWQSTLSSPKVCHQRIGAMEPLATIAIMKGSKKNPDRPRKKKLRTIPPVEEKVAKPPIKLYIGELFHLAGIKQKDAAEHLGIGVSYMSTIINGRGPDGKLANPSYSLLLELSDWMGITVNDLAKPPPPKEEFDRARKERSELSLLAEVLRRHHKEGA